MSRQETDPALYRERVMEAAIEEFNIKGLKFTMDDIAGDLSMSKKTLYKVFSDKEELFLAMVDYCFDAIKKSEREVLEDDSLEITEKIRKVMIVLPAKYMCIDFRKLYSLKDKYPEIFAKVESRLENDWEPTIELIKQGIEQGKIKPISIPVLKSMIEGTMELFLTRDVLIKEDMTYPEALERMMDIVMDGITV